MIQVESLTRRFGPRLAVRNASFAARDGEILGVLGPNGAGKTTTLRMLCGYLPPTSGTARVDGLDVVADSLRVRRRIGYLPENNPLYPEMRVVEYLRFRAALKGVPRAGRATRVDDVVARCGLTAVVRQTIGTLSKGFRQRVGLADALVANPPVLVFDEPTSGLDPNQVHEVRDVVRGLKGAHTVLFSSHQLHEVDQVCDRVVIFREGQVVAEGTTERLRRGASSRIMVTLELAVADRVRLDELAGEAAHPAQVVELDDGWLRVTLEADADPREELFRRAAQLGIVLRELTRRQLSLEEIFHEMTAGKDDTAAEDRP